jgi:thymidylate synthase
MNIIKIEARDLPDLWFQALYNILDCEKFVIDRGSYDGQYRIEYDYFIGHIKQPGSLPLLPTIPSSYNIPNPVEHDYIYGGENYSRSYIEYLMTSTKEEGESYTYGSRLTKSQLDGNILKWFINSNSDIVNNSTVDNTTVFGEMGKTIANKKINKIFVNQIEYVIDTYKKYGHRNNQMVLQIAQPTDIMLVDPPCLRHIDTRIQNNKLHFFVYFRSWDLWGGLPANLAAIQTLKEYMAGEIDVEDGEMLVESKGLHLYGYAEKLAKIRCMVED